MTAVRPPDREPAEDCITSAATGLAKPRWIAARPGPATIVSAATSIETRGKVSLSGWPRPPGRPMARAPPTIHVAHTAALATPIRPRKSPASKVASMPITRAPNTMPGGSPTAAAIVTRGAIPARSGSSERHATRAEAVPSRTMPATRPRGVPSAIAVSAKPPRPGITSPKNSRRLATACALAAAAKAAARPSRASSTLKAGCG